MGYLRVHFRNIIKPDFIPVPGRKFICRNMDHVVCTAWNAGGHPHHHPVFLPIYSKLDIDTAYHYLEIRFGSKGLRVLGAVMFIVYQVGRMSIIMYLPSMVLSNLTGINVNVLIIAMGVIAIIYSYTGGLKSVLWTDFIQAACSWWVLPLHSFTWPRD